MKFAKSLTKIFFVYFYASFHGDAHYMELSHILLAVLNKKDDKGGAKIPETTYIVYGRSPIVYSICNKRKSVCTFVCLSSFGFFFPLLTVDNNKSKKVIWPTIED